MKRRTFLTALPAFIAAPALVRASSLEYVPRAKRLIFDANLYKTVGWMLPNSVTSGVVLLLEYSVPDGSVKLIVPVRGEGPHMYSDMPCNHW